MQNSREEETKKMAEVWKLNDEQNKISSELQKKKEAHEASQHVHLRIE